MPASDRVAIIGHRGARELWPENSLTGFRRTLALGIEGVEFDIHPSRDGALVVIHDPTLERTTEGTGRVVERTAAELAAIRLRGSDEGIPTLDAVLDLFADSDLELHIEIKTDADGRRYRGLERQLLDVIAARTLEDRAILTSFGPRALEVVREIAPRQRVLASVNRRSAEALGGLAAALDRLTAIDGCLVAVEKELLAERLDFCLDRVGGDRLGAWVANEPADLAVWLSQPIRQVTTDRPDLALAARLSKG
jgi:glycerophosphoryl diester phosphodiesterase